MFGRGPGRLFEMNDPVADEFNDNSLLGIAVSSEDLDAVRASLKPQRFEAKERKDWHWTSSQLLRYSYGTCPSLHSIILIGRQSNKIHIPS